MDKEKNFIGYVGEILIAIVIGGLIGFSLCSNLDKQYYISNENYQIWRVHETMKEHYNYCPYCGEELIDMLEAKEI